MFESHHCYYMCAAACPVCQIFFVIIQHIDTLLKYGHKTLDVRSSA